jgi:DeoR/GlpR family transcriptional regulator of sugar metabolism
LNEPVLTEERREQILGRLRADGKVVAAELSTELSVSVDTIRRDLRELATAGLARRVHGGALPPVAGARPYAARREQAVAAKEAIARRTAALFADDQVIVLDAGTTTLEVARHLRPDIRVTVITNSPAIALALADHSHVEVAMLGGMLAKEPRATVGAATVDAVRAIRADVLVLGVCSLHPDIGITVLELEESYVKRAMIENAAEVIAVSSADKLGSAAPYVVAPLDELTHLVTESSASAEQLEPYRLRGIEVLVG